MNFLSAGKSVLLFSPTMKWHMLKVPKYNRGRLFCALLLAFGFFLHQGSIEETVVTSAFGKDFKGYVLEGGQLVVVPHMQKPRRWKILATEWPLCMASVINDSSQGLQLDAFLKSWPGWLSLAVYGPTLDAAHEIIKEVSKSNQNTIDQVSFHVVHPVPGGSLTEKPPLSLLLGVAATNSPCDWVAAVGDVGLRLPPDDGPLSPLEAVLTRLGAEKAPKCLRATQFEVLHLQRLPANMDELMVYNEFGALRQQPNKEVIIARQGPPMQEALMGKCDGPLEKELFFSRLVDGTK